MSDIRFEDEDDGPLCKQCFIGIADEDGFCSDECLRQAEAHKKSKDFLEDYLNEMED